jgi:hypothetical protein
MQTVYYDKQITAKVAEPIYESVLEIAQERGYCLSEYLRHLVNQDVINYRRNNN